MLRLQYVRPLSPLRCNRSGAKASFDLEIRLIGSRDRGFLPIREVPQSAFCADMFIPRADRDRIGYRRGPRRGENALILDCEVDHDGVMIAGWG